MSMQFLFSDAVNTCMPLVSRVDARILKQHSTCPQVDGLLVEFYKLTGF